MTKVVVRSVRQRSEQDGAGISKGLIHLLRDGCIKRPRFSGCWTTPTVPLRSTEIEKYTVLDATVRIISLEGGIRYLYHVSPWEYSMPDDWVGLLERVIGRIASLPPEDLGAPYEDLKGYVRTTSARLIKQLASERSIFLGKDVSETERNVDKLSEIVSRYSVGIGLLEVLLSDKKVEDIFVDAPSWDNPVHLTVNGASGLNTVCRCSTNIVMSEEETTGFSSRLRQYSKRPFSEAFPVLETDLKGFEARATVIGPPISPSGLGIALRRHSHEPWTLTRLAYNGTLSTHAAALISFLIDGKSTALICGARGAGKSSLLSSIMFEFPLSQRILTIEDTLELPIATMQRLGYKVQSLYVDRKQEVDVGRGTDDALRVSLRLGESAIVLGEVRGREAQVLYQSMRTGKAGSSVLGTIHGESARSVYDRVVHDMGISKEAFCATDLVLTMGLSRPGGSTRQIRKLVEISECSRERGPGEFNTLLHYDPASGSLEPEMEGRSEVIARIAASWNISYQEAFRNIEARKKIKDILLAAARQGGLEYLNPMWVCRSNELFWGAIDQGEKDHDAIVKSFKELISRRLGNEIEV